jgi:putative ABC transport system permease protein
MTLVGFAALNSLRNPLRTGLTVLALAIVVVAFVLLRTVITSWNIASEHAAKDRIASRHKVSFHIMLPKRYVETIRQVPGVKAATPVTWFQGKDPRNPDYFFANFMVDPKTFVQVYDEIRMPPEHKARWLEDRQGAIVGRALARRLGLRVGDRFTLVGTLFAGDWVLNVDAIYTAARKSVDENSLMFHWDYVNETLPPQRKDQVGWVTSRVDDPGRGAEVSAAIDRVFDGYDSQTLSMSERQMNLGFLGMVSGLLRAIDAVSLIILLILTMILANTIAMGVRERTAEYGALRALGFLPRHIRFFIVGESFIIGLSAGLLGIGIALPLIDRVLGQFVEDSVGSLFPSFRVAPTTLVLAIVLSMLLGVLAGLVPAVLAGRQSVVNALRRAE